MVFGGWYTEIRVIHIIPMIMSNPFHKLSAAEVQKIAEEGSRIYDSIKSQYEPEHKGEFMAIDIESQEVFIADTNSEVVEKAKGKYPDKVFYVVKIGYSAAETLASIARV